MNYFKNIVFLLIYFLDYFVPKRKESIIFTSFPDFSDNAFSLFLYISKQKKTYQRIWLVDHPERKDDYRKIASNYGISLDFKIIRKNSLSGVYFYLVSKYVFFTHGLYTGVKIPKKHIVVNLWHGMPLKKIGYLDKHAPKNLQKSKYVIATSPLFQELMSKAFCLPKESAVVTGQPRNDLLFSQTDALHKIGIDKKEFNRIFMWMPTYRKSKIGDIRDDGAGDFRDLFGMSNDDIFSINETLKIEKSLLLVKLHPMDSLSLCNFIGLSNIKLIKNAMIEKSGCQLYELLSQTDALITDFSSVYIDFLLTNRPIGFAMKDYDQYLNNRGFVFENALSYMPGVIIQGMDDMINFIKHPKVASNYDLVRGQFHYYTTSFSERVCKDILE